MNHSRNDGAIELLNTVNYRIGNQPYTTKRSRVRAERRPRTGKIRRGLTDIRHPGNSGKCDGYDSVAQIDALR